MEGGHDISRRAHHDAPVETFICPRLIDGVDQRSGVRLARGRVRRDSYQSRVNIIACFRVGNTQNLGVDLATADGFRSGFGRETPREHAACAYSQGRALLLQAAAAARGEWWRRWGWVHPDTRRAPPLPTQPSNSFRQTGVRRWATVCPTRHRASDGRHHTRCVPVREAMASVPFPRCVRGARPISVGSLSPVRVVLAVTGELGLCGLVAKVCVMAKVWLLQASDAVRGFGMHVDGHLRPGGLGKDPLLLATIPLAS